METRSRALLYSLSKLYHCLLLCCILPCQYLLLYKCHTNIYSLFTRVLTGCDSESCRFSVARLLPWSPFFVVFFRFSFLFVSFFFFFHFLLLLVTLRQRVGKINVSGRSVQSESQSNQKS